MKHGWEKKWIVLDDQMLQLFDKENMGGKAIFSPNSSQFLSLVFLSNYIVVTLVLHQLSHKSTVQEHANGRNLQKLIKRMSSKRN